MKEVYGGIVSFLKNYQERTHVKGYVLGISGGKDSTIVAKLLVDAIGKENVLGVLMPNGEQKDIEDSVKVCKLLGINYQKVNISETYQSLKRSIERGIRQKTNSTNVEHYANPIVGSKYIISEKSLTNVAPRIRMTTLYAIAQSLGYRVAGTSNASELFIGWGTKWGDLASDINPISQLTCSEVISLGDYMGLPYDLIHKTPADGLTGKSDEENFGFTYKELDTLIVKQRNLTCTGRIQCAFTEQELKILKLHEAAYHKDHVIKIHY
jgi:NAD+ synthase